MIVLAIEASDDHRGNRFHVALLSILQALANRNFRRRHREWRIGRHLERVVANVLLKFFSIHNSVDEPHVQRLVRVEEPRREQDVARVGRSHGLREHVNPVERVRKSEPRRGNAKPGPARRDTNVASERDLHSAADTHAGNHRDNRLVAFDQRRDCAIRRVAIRARLLRIISHRGKLGDIRARDKCLRRGAAHNDHANRVVARELLNPFRDTLPGPQIQRISNLRPI